MSVSGVVRRVEARERPPHSSPHPRQGMEEIAVRCATAAMGTRFEFVLCGRDAAHLRSVGELCVEEIELWHRRLSRFERGSDIARLNDRAPHEPVRVDAELFELLELCSRVWRESNGAFDPAVGMLMDAWMAGDAGTPRDTAEPAATFGEVLLDPSRQTVTFARPLALDLGAIGKGWALDRAAAICREHGIASALLHGGTSSVVAIGSPPGEDAWRIRVASTGSPLEVSLRDRAMGVSAPRGRMLERDSSLGGHVMDPHEGVPASSARDTAMVIAESAALADAWSTAALVHGGPPGTPPSPTQFMMHHSETDTWERTEIA